MVGRGKGKRRKGKDERLWNRGSHLVFVEVNKKQDEEVLWGK